MTKLSVSIVTKQLTDTYTRHMSQDVGRKTDEKDATDKNEYDHNDIESGSPNDESSNIALFNRRFCP